MKTKRLLITLFLVASILSSSFALAAGQRDYGADSVIYSSSLNVAEGINNSSADELSAASSNIIVSHYLMLLRSGNTLTARGQTCTDKVSLEIGFTYVKIQKYVNGSWQDVSSWTKIYNTNSLVCSTVKSTNVSSGTYRAVCEHYAKQKTILWFTQTEKIYNYTTSLTI